MSRVNILEEPRVCVVSLDIKVYTTQGGAFAATIKNHVAGDAFEMSATFPDDLVSLLSGYLTETFAEAPEPDEDDATPEWEGAGEPRSTTEWKVRHRFHQGGVE